VYWHSVAALALNICHIQTESVVRRSEPTERSDVRNEVITRDFSAESDEAN